MTEDGYMDVVCTDRGQHPRAIITRVRWGQDGESMPYAPIGRSGNAIHDEYDDRSAPSWSMPNTTAAEGEGSWNAYTFWCRRCNRDLQVRQDRWWQMVAECKTANIRSVDISLLT